LKLKKKKKEDGSEMKGRCRSMRFEYTGQYFKFSEGSVYV